MKMFTSTNLIKVLNVIKIRNVIRILYKDNSLNKMNQSSLPM